MADSKIIHPEIEPEVIDTAMITDCYLRNAYHGEAERLHNLEKVNFERITSIRFEYRNILRIDHLWVLPNLTKLHLNSNKIEVIEHLQSLVNLKELDLSFNYILKIENLEKLVKLEILSLFSNLITKIENLDELENLIILSIGNNQINTTNGIERLRFMRKLRVLNLEGNPVSKDKNFEFTTYIAGVLPELKYYEYKVIPMINREKAEELFKRELREIANNQETEMEQRTEAEKERRDGERLASSFVEGLNGHQLYKSLWRHDEDGPILLKIGAEARELAKEYENEVYAVTQQLYKFGLKKYEERESEIKVFNECIELGQQQVQEQGQRVIDDFVAKKDEIREKAKTSLMRHEQMLLDGEDVLTPETSRYVQEYDRLSIVFDDMLNDVWQILMSQELHLHETVEETTQIFQRNLQEMVFQFVELARTFFTNLREITIQFAENIFHLVSTFLSESLTNGDLTDVPAELRVYLEDREALMNLAAGLKDAHIQVIEEREDLLVSRSKNFVQDMIDQLNKDELERKRIKILEITSFIEMMNQSMQELHAEVREAIENEI